MNDAHKRRSDGAREFPKDKPLRFSIGVETDEDLGAMLGAQPTKNKRKVELRNMLLAILVYIFWHEPTAWIFYSRDRNKYSQQRQYLPPCASYQRMMWAVDMLEEAGIIQHDRRGPGQQDFRSRFRLAYAVIPQFPITHVSQLQYVVGETIRLKDENKRLIPYSDDDNIRAMRIDVIAQNEALRSIKIDLVNPSWRIDHRGLYRKGPHSLALIDNQLYRVFNRDFSLGGRFAWPFWHSMPGALRTDLQIDGQPTVELDYEFLHPRLLSALTGKNWGDGDPYVLDGFERREGKGAFQTLVNAKDAQSAILAVAEKYRTQGVPNAYEQARSIIEAIIARHPQFEPYWCLDLGRRLQNIDSGICAEVQAEMRARGEVVLSVHDSFIVRQTAEHVLREVMDRVLESTLQRLRKQST